MDALRALLAASAGQLPEDTVERLGGWKRVADELPRGVDDPASVVLIRILAQDAAAGGPDVAAALPAIVDAVLAMESPGGFSESVDALVASPAVLGVVADGLADGLLAQVAAFVDLDDPSARDVWRAATALEAVTRLNVGGYGSKFSLLATLERFRAPAPKRLAAAVVRSVGTAVDHWHEAASLTKVVEVISGLKAPTGPQAADADPEDVASDASWVLANIELVQALRAATRQSMLSHLESSVRYLSLGVETYDRDDARVLAPIVGAVGALTRAEPGVAALDVALPSAGDLEQLVDQQTKLNVSLSGLNHWYADVKRQTTAAWVMLVEDLARAREQLAKEAFYRPEAIIDDLLNVYRASRSVEIVRRVEDFDGVLEVVQPVIEAGFASNTGFVANLAEYTRRLEERLEQVEDEERVVLVEQHAVAAEVLTEARAVLARGEPPGKGGGGTATAPLPRRLEELFGSDPAAIAKLAELGQDRLARLEEAVESTSAARHSTLQEARVLRSLESALSASTDYVGKVKIAIDELVLAMVRFVGSRQNAQESRRPYLFDPLASESALHEDLYDYLSYAVGPLLDIEVQQVGGGRADLRVKYGGFSVYLELKSDDTMKPLSDKGAYLQQAVTYQATDVRIGFVVALRVKAFPQAGAHPHLTSLFTHATADVAGDADKRHLVLVEVPGNRSSPSAKKAKV
ncbi:hypothetical protein D9V41_08735 [Aeromicrobium phragmitis]|uniref:Uncharacterized protein n=1 Tax=Aeromicrobium phragmitis TaxID=2478914 RepID=A0A3L8PMI5_9ACTN|nr:hypothetical protein [Aeromicrobium phragmitis]RLV55973.1 hypothetical protein D9V41_08735 [Aeromicrobium phragmitis]